MWEDIFLPIIKMAGFCLLLFAVVVGGRYVDFLSSEQRAVECAAKNGKIILNNKDLVMGCIVNP